MKSAVVGNKSQRRVCALAGASFVALASAGGAVAQDAQAAEAATVRIDAQPLDRALVDLGRQYGVLVVAPEETTAGKTANAFSGEYGLEEAFARLLDGSGLGARIGASGAVIISRQTASAAPRIIEASANADNMLAIRETIIVTGEKTDRTLQETKSSVSVLTRDQLDESYIVDLREALLRIPNVSINAGGEGLSIRGIPQQGLGAGTFDPLSPTTAIYIDGAVQTQAGAANGILSTWDVDQVEVFRGPQTATQGRAGLAGALIVNTADPTFEWEGRARASYGTNDRQQYGLALGGPLIDDVLAFRIAGEVIRDDGFTTFEDNGVTVDDPGREKRELIRGKLLFTPAPWVETLLTVAYADAERGENIVNGPDFFDGVNASIINGDNTEVFTTTLVTDIDLSDVMQLRSITAYTDLDRNGAPLEGTEDGVGFAIPFEGEDRAITQELRLSYDAGGSLRWLAGAYFADIEERFERTIAGPFGPFLILRNDGFEKKFENYAFFGQVEYDLTPALSVVVGGRYETEDNVNVQFGLTDVEPDTPVFPDEETFFTGAGSQDAFLPKAGVTYKFDDDISLSFTFQRAYRPGGTDEDPETGEGIEFEPEFANNYDLALRSSFFDGVLTVNANAFYIQYNDQQLRVAPDPAFPFRRFIGNTGESDLYGLEIETRWRPTDELSFYGSLGVLESEFESFEVGGVSVEGGEFPRSPNINAAFGGTWDHPSGLIGSLDFTYSDEFFSNISPQPDTVLVDSFFLVDTRIGYKADNWGVFFYAENLFDEDYLLSVDRALEPLPGGNLGRPRTLGVILEAAF